MRNFLTDYGRRLLVWLQGHKVPGRDPDVWRQDDFGNLIRYQDYGDRNSRFGWEIDHRRPNALGGLGTLDNLRPLHCRANASLGGLLGRLLSEDPTDPTKPKR
jgi:hypothetical protein